MLGQLIFIIISVILFGTIFFKMIKKNETGYIIVLGLESLGIIIDGVEIITNQKLNIVLKLLIYTMSIILPLAILILEYKNIDVINIIKFAKVNFYIKMENYKKAKDILIKMVEKDPNNYMAHKNLAIIYEKEGGIRKAIDEYVMCIEINKKDYDSYYKVATLLSDLDRKDEAIQMLSSLLEKKPSYYNASITLGDLLIEKESYKEATSVLQEALKYNPESFDINYYLGMAYTLLNDFQSAKESYEKAAELNHLKFNTKYCLAQIALLYKDIEVAEKFFQESLEEEELQADSYYELAKISLMKGEKETAIKYANIAIDLESRKISEKIKKEPLFIPIRSKISIPFNLEEKETDEKKLTDNEIKAKEHLENTSIITMNMGYVNFKKTNNSLNEKNINDIQIENENL